MHRSFADILPYLVPLLTLQAAWLVARRADSERATAAAVWLAAIPLFLIVGLRGNVGTDTDTYRTLFLELQSGYQTSEGFEPGFLVLARTLLKLTDDAAIAVNLTSVIIIAVMIGAALRTERTAAIFILVVAPTFLLDMSMNGLRYGLAFGLAQHAVCDIERRSHVRGALLALLAVSVHSSAALVVGVLLLVIGASARVTIVTFAASLVILRLFADTLATKLLDYQDFLAPSELSGLGPAAITAALLLFLAASRASLRGASAWSLVVFGALGSATFALARVSYAGLRFQVLVLFCLLVYLQIQAVRAAWELPRWALVTLWLIGALSFALKARNFYDDYDVGAAPFLPYRLLGDDWNG